MHIAFDCKGSKFLSGNEYLILTQPFIALDALHVNIIVDDPKTTCFAYIQLEVKHFDPKPLNSKKN